jgi:hypothetical protein
MASSLNKERVSLCNSLHENRSVLVIMGPKSRISGVAVDGGCACISHGYVHWYDLLPRCWDLVQS